MPAGSDALSNSHLDCSDNSMRGVILQQMWLGKVAVVINED